ncbi:energy-converting hydrogenase A subunit E [Methanococcus voltae]|jgi:energy-converting hydrogenase A subunit E|uniref:Energy-converting hydrogenase A subunit E n=2 Tax=Methanococcus voltae TaxID=2188 RepID=A0A8J7UTJ0_METVO|nr:EhaE family protein [Methanococcus voltae]MBP2143765.1 energy-converting hydrogenase A subunit E [Methanococcus voltae]MBP2172861.1 energy-converting hydrogenase A subunit E [Methanococcus voltae]MBP2201729.1 energy-converting hydrogenase A subunit E [Methanococcus voltae]MCS3922517.1 energy-converting hydrogenase A subunit E [Methanococcus voltae PS]
MELVQYTLYTGYILLILGTIGAVMGPMSKDPIKKLLNVEVPSIGLSLILLAYNHTLALMTFLAVNAAIGLVLIRAVIKTVENTEE